MNQDPITEAYRRGRQDQRRETRDNVGMSVMLLLFPPAWPWLIWKGCAALVSRIRPNRARFPERF